jgi:HTH-type transcriptional regulator / antitoxin HigA
LTLAMMRNLHNHFGIPAETLLSEGRAQINWNVAPDYEKFPLVEMAKRGYFGESHKSLPIPQLKNRAEEFICGFLNPILVGNNHELAFLPAPQLQSGARGINDYALLVWTAQVKKKARQEHIEMPYQKGVIDDGWVRELIKLSRFKEGPKLAKEYLARYGIALVIEPHFNKTYLDGAAILDGNRAIIGVTLRHNRLDNFWFVLLHEIAHIKLHLNANTPEITDNLDDKVQQAESIEKEADVFAQEALIPAQYWANSAVRTSYLSADAVKLARELDISITIIAGRVRHETGNWRLLQNHLNKDNVKMMFGLELDD